MYIATSFLTLSQAHQTQCILLDVIVYVCPTIFSIEKLGGGGENQAISWALKQGLVRLNIDAAIVGNVGEGDE
ncbi:hypothetical protein [Aeromonas sp. 2MA4]|uniref:hypothetical protein n=1 Tax=Aeromonas sp. 2MA4 TaxID=2699195 RepID=UPI0023DDE2FC|nr:hypothetical protein [Aeromonas sp. 2MA4]